MMPALQLEAAVRAIIADGCRCDFIVRVRQDCAFTPLVQVIHDNDCPTYPAGRRPRLRLVEGVRDA